MKRLIFWGSILGTIGAFLAACLVAVLTLFWLIRTWHPAPWVVWGVGLGLAVASVAVIWRWWRLPVERRFRFSLRGMLLGVTLFALWFGVVGVGVLRCGREGVAVRDLRQRGVMLNHAPHPSSDWARTRVFLLRTVGYDPLQKTQCITIRSDEGLPALLEHAKDLPHLVRVNFHRRVTEMGMNRVGELSRISGLQSVFLLDCPVTDVQIGQLTQLKQLKNVCLRSCGRITDESLAYLRHLPELEYLCLNTYPNVKMSLTDAGLEHVGRMLQIERLMIRELPISDDGIVKLQGLKNLERIDLWKTQVTESGIGALCEALPDCFVMWGKAGLPAVSQIRLIEVWRKASRSRRLVTITSQDRIRAIKEWLDSDDRLRYPYGGEWYQEWRDGSSGACLNVRFEGHRRRLCEIGLGNGVYHSAWGDYCRLSP